MKVSKVTLCARGLTQAGINLRQHEEKRHQMRHSAPFFNDFPMGVEQI